MNDELEKRKEKIKEKFKILFIIGDYLLVGLFFFMVGMFSFIIVYKIVDWIN